jgi:hypothetical protein
MTEREICYQKGWSWEELADFYGSDPGSERMMFEQYLRREIAKV